MIPSYSDDKKKSMLQAIHIREGRWEGNTVREIERIGDNIGLDGEHSQQLFVQLMDEGYIDTDTGRIMQAGGSDTGRRGYHVVSASGKAIPVGNNIKLTDQGRSWIG